jgi:site-specific DNA-methyltransferase (adenine-specific)
MAKTIETKAPRNRGVFLTPDDYIKYTPDKLSGESEPVAIGQAIDHIFNGDALAGMARLPEASFDLIFADPPYFGREKDFGEGSIKMSLAEYTAWSEDWIKRAVRLLKPDGSMYVCCDWRFAGLLQGILSKYITIKNRITWLREKGRGSKRNWKEDMEDIWFGVKGEGYTFNLDAVKLRKPIVAPYRDGNKRPKDWNENAGEPYRYTCPPNIWLDTVVPFWSMPEDTSHPAQKPEKLVERIVLASSNPGDKVFDPFMGSGTTAVVAKRLGRNFTGFELNEEYIRLALKRLDMLKNEPVKEKKEKYRLVMMV